MNLLLLFRHRYARLGLARVGLPPGLPLDPERVEAMLKQQGRVVVYFSLSLLLAPVVETLVLLDRMIYLRENGEPSSLTTHRRHALGTKVCVFLQVWTVGSFLSSTRTSLRGTLCWWLRRVLDKEEGKVQIQGTRTRVCVDFGLFLKFLSCFELFNPLKPYVSYLRHIFWSPIMSSCGENIDFDQ